MPRASRSKSYHGTRGHPSSSRRSFKRGCSKLQYKSYFTAASIKYCKYSSSCSSSPSNLRSKDKSYRRKNYSNRKNYRSRNKSQQGGRSISKYGRREYNYDRRNSPYRKQSSQINHYQERKENVWVKTQNSFNQTYTNNNLSNNLPIQTTNNQYNNYHQNIQDTNKESQLNQFYKKCYQYEPPRLEITPIEKTESLNQTMIPGLSSTYIQAVPDSQKYKTKIFLPRNTGINYVGLLIGPKGIYQKKLEEQTGCKILIRGRGSHKEGHPMQFDDQEDQHVLIIGESEDKIQIARTTVHRVLTADEETRNAIRSDQLKAAQEMSKDIYKVQPEDYLLTPYGPPSPSAYIIPVPNECVGLIIGKGGETIRNLQMKSGSKIQVAKKEIPGTNMRNVFIEGPPEKFDGAKKLIEDIVSEHRRIQENFSQIGEVNPFPRPYSYFPIPNTITDVIIGFNGTTIKSLYQKTGCYIFIPKEVNSKNERVLQLSGNQDQIEKCKIELNQILRNVSNYAYSTGQELSTSLSASYVDQQEFSKKSLIDQALKEQQLLLPNNMSFYTSEIKEEPDTNSNNNTYSQMINQKDFLFDPYAAAYYERFSQFKPGKPINFNDFVWPTQQRQSINQQSSYKTFYQEYMEQYGEKIQNPSTLEAQEFASTNICSQNLDYNTSNNLIPHQQFQHQQDPYFTQDYSCDFSNQYFNSNMIPYNQAISEFNYSQQNYPELSQMSYQQNYSMMIPNDIQYTVNNNDQQPSAVSLFYQCFGPEGALNKSRTEPLPSSQYLTFQNVNKPNHYLQHINQQNERQEHVQENIYKGQENYDQGNSIGLCKQETLSKPTWKPFQIIRLAMPQIEEQDNSCQQKRQNDDFIDTEGEEDTIPLQVS